MAVPMFGEADVSNLFNQVWAHTADRGGCSWDPGPCSGYPIVVDPKDEKVKELEKKVEELDVINKPGVRWLRKKV